MSVAQPRAWVHLLSLDVLEFDERGGQLRLRFSADSAAGAYTGDIELQTGTDREMAQRLFHHLSLETLRQIGLPAAGTVLTNAGDVASALSQFFSGFRQVLAMTDLEPMEIALAKTAGIDFFSKTVSLWGKELPERVRILLRRATSNLRFGYPEECIRDLAKIEVLEPGNAEAERLRRQAGEKPSPPRPPAPVMPPAASPKLSSSRASKLTTLLRPVAATAPKSKAATLAESLAAMRRTTLAKSGGPPAPKAAAPVRKPPGKSRSRPPAKPAPVRAAAVKAKPKLRPKSSTPESSSATRRKQPLKKVSPKKRGS